MAFIKKCGLTCGVLVAIQAVFIGLLKVRHPLLSPGQQFVLAEIDRFADDFVEPASSNLKWAHDFGGGFEPVEPVQGQALTVRSGAIPADCSGAWLRVGPMIQFWPPKKRTHVFDGDGMIVSVRIKEGKAVYNSEFVQTPRYLFEKAFGGEYFARIGEWYGKAGLFKLLAVAPLKSGAAGLEPGEGGTANTAIGLTPDKKLWANQEASMPYRIRLQDDGRVESLGFDDLNGTLNGLAISAHPKYDYRTGETFFHGREMLKRFYVGRIKDGRLQEMIDLQLDTGFHHDMFITKDYVVVVDGAMRFLPKNVVTKKPLWVMSPNATLRFGVLPRDMGAWSPDSVIWIDTNITAEVVHTMFAQNEGDKINLWCPTSYYDGGQEDGILGDIGPAYMHKITIDVGTRKAAMDPIEQPVDRISTEFSRARDDRNGQAVRFGYSGIQGDGLGFNFTGLLKWDMMEQRRCGQINFPPGVVGGEPVFIPKAAHGGAGEADDAVGDDGYIGLLLWDYIRRESTYVVYDARSFEETPVVELLLPVRAPLGFHALWVSESDLQTQLNVP